MNVSIRVQLSSTTNKLVDEIIVLLPANTWFLHAEIDLVVSEFLVVGATVEDNGERAVGVDACAEGREDKFGDGD